MSRAPLSASWSPRASGSSGWRQSSWASPAAASEPAGKSDPIDALAVSRAALREGPETLPAAHLDEAALELKLLLDHREDLVKTRSEDQQRLRWHLHDLWPEMELPAGCLDRIVWLERVARKLARAEQGARVRVSRELVRAIRERTKRAALPQTPSWRALPASRRSPPPLAIATAVASTVAATANSTAPCIALP